MEFLVEFEVNIPAGTPDSEVVHRATAEAAAAAALAEKGLLVRIWKLPVDAGGSKAVGLYRTEDRMHLDRVLRELPLREWLKATVTPLEPHPNDPGEVRAAGGSQP
jgi:muconolactone delta-isomerase